MKYLFLIILLNSTILFGKSLEEYVPKAKKSIHFKLSDTQIEGFEHSFKTQSFAFINDYKDFLYGIEVESLNNEDNDMSVNRYNFVIGYEKKEKFFTFPYILFTFGKNRFDFNEFSGEGFSNSIDIGTEIKKIYPLNISGGFRYTNDYFHEYGNSKSYDLYLRFSFNFK